MENFTMDILFYNNGDKNIDINYDDEFKCKLQKIKFSSCNLLIITDTSNANYKRLNSQVASSWLLLILPMQITKD